MLIDGAYPEETRVIVTNDGEIEDFDYETKNKQQIRGNLYLAKIARVEPSLQAAFVDYGKEKHGFLSFNEIHPDYFQIPVADRKILVQHEKELTEKFSTKESNGPENGETFIDDKEITISDIPETAINEGEQFSISFWIKTDNLPQNKVGSTIKRIHAGKAAQSGILAALLAKSGITAPYNILETDLGFFKGYSDNYDENKIIPHYETFDFVPDGSGSGFVIGDGKYVITNLHVTKNAKRIAVRNGIGKVSYAKVYDISKKYDLALLELEQPYSKKYSIESKYFVKPKTGEEVVTIGFPGIGIGYSQEAELPIITQGIISKVFKKGDYQGRFMTTIAINSGNSGGPIFNLKLQLVGVAYATTGMTKGEIEDLLKGKQTTSFGLGIESTKIKEVFGYTQSTPIKEAKYSKEKIYEKTLPSVVIVAVQFNQ